MGVDGSIVARRTSDQRVEWVFVDGFTQAATVDTTGAGDIFGTAWSLFIDSVKGNLLIKDLGDLQISFAKQKDLLTSV